MRYIDTNIFLRYLTEKKEDLPQELIDFFQSLQEGNINVKCLDIVFFQVIFVLKSFYKVEKDKIIKSIESILALNGLHTKNKRVLERTLELWEQHPDDIIDCYIVANMERDGENELYTFDKKIRKLGVKSVNLV